MYKSKFVLIILLILVLGVGLCLLLNNKQNKNSKLVSVKQNSTFDIQGHRGSRGLFPEESLVGFTEALRIGVSTLELDIVLSKDGIPLVWHDGVVTAEKCRDTAPAFANDSQFPYVGKPLKQLTYTQVKTLVCGTKPLKEFPEQKPLSGAKIIKLAELFDLVKKTHNHVYFNIETKIDINDYSLNNSPQTYIDAIMKDVKAANMLSSIMIQSFDWNSLVLVQQQFPQVPTVALYEPESLTSANKYIFAGLDPKDYQYDALKMIHRLKFQVASPRYSLDSLVKKISDPGFEFYTNASFVNRAHKLGIKVIPWTINDSATMAAQIDQGVDGIITDYPNILRDIVIKKQLSILRLS